MKLLELLLSIFLFVVNVKAEKVCTITSENDFVDYSNILKYTGCTVVNGNIRIVGVTFEGDPYYNYPGLHPDMFEVFSSIKTITGYLQVQGKHPDFRSLSYFRNLEVIEGRELKHNTSLQVLATSLSSLDLTSLTAINNGNVGIFLNRNLCYADSVYFPSLFKSRNQRAVVKLNKPYTECVLRNKICHPRCDDNGCWGAGIEKCVGEVMDSNKIEDWIFKGV